AAQRRRAVVFVVSDFLADGYESALAVLSRRHDVVPVVVSDPVEEKLPELRGLWPVIDAESGETALLDFSDARTRAAYAVYARDRAASRDKIFRKLSLETVRVRPGDEYVAPLAALFLARARWRPA